MLTLAVSSNLRCELHWNVLVACFQWRQTCVSSASFQMKSRLSAPLHEKLTRVEKLQSVCVTWSRTRRYFSCTVLFSFTVTWLFFVVVFLSRSQERSSRHSRCCAALAASWSQSEGCVVCSGSTWRRPSSRYWQLLSWSDGSWASSGEWTWSSWRVSTCLALFVFSVLSGLSVLFASPLLFMSVLSPFVLSVSHMTYSTVRFWA